MLGNRKLTMVERSLALSRLFLRGTRTKCHARRMAGDSQQPKASCTFRMRRFGEGMSAIDPQKHNRSISPHRGQNETNSESIARSMVWHVAALVRAQISKCCGP